MVERERVEVMIAQVVLTWELSRGCLREWMETKVGKVLVMVRVK